MTAPAAPEHQPGGVQTWTAGVQGFLTPGGFQGPRKRGAVDDPWQQASPVVGEAAGNPGTTDGERTMNTMNKMTRTEEEPALREVETSKLTEITGGTIWVSDGYCVSPWHPPLPLPLLAVATQKPGEIGAITAGSR